MSAQSLLSATSALVLIYDGGKSYQTPKAGEFFRRLDLSAGRPLYRKFAHLSNLDQIIRGRKRGIHSFLERFLTSRGPEAQVIFFGCGWDPALVKMSERFPENSFIGVDQSLSGQEQLTREILPSARVSYLEWDISQPDQLLKGLKSKGWRPEAPLCAALEGIVYYIPPEALWRIISSLKSCNMPDFCLAGDYLLDLEDKSLAPEARKTGRDIFEAIKKDCGLDAYYMYSRGGMRKKILALGSSARFMSARAAALRPSMGASMGIGESADQKDCHIELFFASNSGQNRLL